MDLSFLSPFSSLLSLRLLLLLSRRVAVGRSVWWRAVRTSPSLASGLVLSPLLPPSAQFYSSCNLAFKIVSFSNSNRAVSLFILRRGGFCAVDTPVVARSPPSPSSHLSPLPRLCLSSPSMPLSFSLFSFRLFSFFLFFLAIRCLWLVAPPTRLLSTIFAPQRERKRQNGRSKPRPAAAAGRIQAGDMISSASSFIFLFSFCFFRCG